MIRFACALFVFSLALLSGVARGDETIETIPPMRFDQVRLSESLRGMIIDDMKALDALEFGPRLDPHFKLLFGGTTARSIEMYLLKRVHYVGVDIDEKTHEMDQTVYAANYGADFLGYYYHSKVLRDRSAKPDTVDFENAELKLTHPRMGFVGIGGAYVDPNTSQMDRIDTWVHEARHSDCAKLPSDADLEAYDKDLNAQVSLFGQACTYLHVPCPAGHPLAGELACDAVPWGAYTAGFVFSKNVYYACTNCTEAQKQAALAGATDDYSRMMPSAKQILRTANPPAPVLSSYDDFMLF